jgi:hypothetical protein
MDFAGNKQAVGRGAPLSDRSGAIDRRHSVVSVMTLDSIGVDATLS